MQTVATNTKIEIVPPRAERRRQLADHRRQERYAESGHVDRVRPAPTIDRGIYDENGNPLARPLSADDIHKRAVARRDRDLATYKGLAMAGVTRHELGRIFDRRAPHANRSTAERRHSDRRTERAKANLAYATGLLNNAKGLHANGKQMPLHYLNRGERERVLEQRFGEPELKTAA